MGDPVLRGGPLPGPGRHARPARRGLGRPSGHRAGRPHHRDDQHRRRADPRAGAAHGPVLAGEGRADLERGLRQRGPPQGRQRLGPLRPQARGVLRRRRRGRRGRRASRTSTPTFSPYAAPPVADFDAVNARMLVRSEQRAPIRDAWAVGTPYIDTLVHTVRITPSTPQRTGTGAGAGGAARRRPAGPRRPARAVAAAPRRSPSVSCWRLLAFLLNLTPAVVIGVGLVTMLGIQTTVAVDRGRRLAEDLARPPSIEQIAYAVADGLHDAGLTPSAPRRCSVEVDDDGGAALRRWRASPPRCRRRSRPRSTRWSRRWRRRATCCRAGCCTSPVDNADGIKAALGLLRPDGEVWHSVPTVLGTTGKRAQAFAAAWDLWVGGGPAIYTGSPEGEGVLVTHRGSDPFAVDHRAAHQLALSVSRRRCGPSPSAPAPAP